MGKVAQITVYELEGVELTYGSRLFGLVGRVSQYRLSRVGRWAVLIGPFPVLFRTCRASGVAWFFFGGDMPIDVMPVDVNWKTYVEAQRGLSAMAGDYDYVVESAIALSAEHCGWKQETVARLTKDALKQLREIITRYAQKHKDINQFGEYALQQVVVYLMEREESSPWLRILCQDTKERSISEDESLPITQSEKAVARATFAIKDIPNALPTSLPPGALYAWAAVLAVYDASRVDKFTEFLFNRNKLQIQKFQHKLTPFCNWWGVPKEDVKQILLIGFKLAMIRWEPGRARHHEHMAENDPTFQTTALRWMQNVFWTAPEILKGCPQDLFRLIGVIWKRQGLFIEAATATQPASEESIAKLINKFGGLKKKKITANRVINALAVARTMQFETLVAMAQQYENDQGTSDIDPLAEGPDALEDARAGCAGFPDPSIGVIWNLERLLVQAAAGRHLPPEEIVMLINPFGGFKNKRVTSLQVKNALAVASTMQFESLQTMAQRYGNNQGDTSDIDPLAEGSGALEAANAGCATFPDPAKQYESKDFVMKFEALAKQILSPQEEDVFGLRALNTDNKSWAEIAVEMGVTEKLAQRLYKRAKNKLSADPRVNQLLLSTMDTH